MRAGPRRFTRASRSKPRSLPRSRFAARSCRREKLYIEDVIALSEDLAKRLQADLEVARTQQAKVNDYQRQTQDEAAALREEKERAQAQLRQVQGQVMLLQRQMEMGLPVPEVKARLSAKKPGLDKPGFFYGARAGLSSELVGDFGHAALRESVYPLRAGVRRWIRG